MTSKETIKSTLISRGLAARDSARVTNRYISSDQVMAELMLMLKQVQQKQAAKMKPVFQPR